MATAQVKRLALYITPLGQDASSGTGSLSNPLTGNLDAGGFKITGLGAGSGPADSIRFDQAVSTPMTQDLDGGGFEFVNAHDPTTDQSLVTRAYGDANYLGMGDFRKDGTVAMTGDFNGGGHLLTNISLGVSPTDAVILSQTTTNPFNSDVDAGGFQLKNLADGTDPQDALTVAQGTTGFIVNPMVADLDAGGHNITNIGDDGLTCVVNDANHNVIIGGSWQTSAATGNLVVGPLALLSVSAGINNCAVGQGALTNVDTGSTNVALGPSAGATETSGSNNTFVGNSSDTSDATVSNSMALGHGAIVTKSDQVVIGDDQITEVLFPGDATVLSFGSAANLLIVDSGGTFLSGKSVIQPPPGSVRNIGIGEGVLVALTTGDNNIALGQAAGAHLTTGSNSVAIGGGALTLATAGTNVAIGQNSMAASTTASTNAAIGTGSLANNITGNFNVAVGATSASGHTSGDDGVYVGAGAGTTLGSGSGQIAIGAGATATAANQIVIGSITNSGPAIVVATGAPVNGSHPNGSFYMRTNGTADGNYLYHAESGAWVAIADTGGSGGGDFMADGSVPMTGTFDAGTHKLTNVVDPSSNQDAATKKYVDDNAGSGDFLKNGSVAMTGDFNAGGFQVTNVGGTGSAGLDLKFDTHYNMAIGPDTILPTGGAGSATTNTAIGGGTLGGVVGSPSSVSGYANTAVGASALGRITSAHNNTAVGTNAGGLITTGLENVAVGQDSLVHLTTGSQFAAVGVDALNQAAGGNSCSALGHQAGQGITTGSDVVAVGQDSAHGHTTGDNSVYVGSGSKTTTGSVSGVVAVGFGAQVTATGQICIGAKGDFRPCIISASGAPSNGSHVDGSLYIRQDGGVGTTLYFASGGTWSAIL